MARTARRRVVNTGDNAGGNLGTQSGDGLDGNAGGGGSPEQSPDGTLIIDPADIGSPVGSDGGNSIGGAGSADTGTRRRGRRPGAPQKKVALDVSGVEQLLFSVHMMLAGLTRTPELVLAPEEAKTMAEAMGKVSRHYDVTVGAKAMDWANMAMVAGMVYGSRLVAMRQRGRAAPAMAQQPQAPRQPPATPAPPSGNGNTVVNIPGLGMVDVGGA